jgi:hypothetical protein
MLMKAIGDHCHERVTVPGSSFEIVEAKILFQLLMGLFSDPSCSDGGSSGAQVHRGR